MGPLAYRAQAVLHRGFVELNCSVEECRACHEHVYGKDRYDGSHRWPAVVRNDEGEAEVSWNLFQQGADFYFIE